MHVRVQVIFYSTYGHVWKLAEAIAEGARGVSGDVKLMRVEETLPRGVLEKMGAVEAQTAFADVPIASPRELDQADVIFLGSPTRYGSAAAQMRAFLDNTGGLWASNALVGKVGSAFASTASQHGGQETTLQNLHNFFFHQGMVIAGVPYSTAELSNISELSGGTPYGSTTVAGTEGQRQPSGNELAIARAQGRFATEIGRRLFAVR